MDKLKTIFFGTHEFAAYILQGLIENPLFEVALVITQPDQPVGRKHILTPPLTKLIAEKYTIPVAQPETLKNFQFPIVDFDLSIVIEYGRIIPARLLSIPKYQTLNIHPSLLPKYRGPTPIQFALLHGEEKTAVTIMQMDATMDTGPILLQKELAITTEDTYTTLSKKLMPLALEALFETVPKYIDGNIKPVAQNNDAATYCKILSREDGKIDWAKSAHEIYNQYRAFTPWPGIWTTWGDKRLKLLEIKPDDKHLNPGQVYFENNKIYIGTSKSALEILSLQLEGKPAMDPKTFANGYKSLQGVTLG